MYDVIVIGARCAGSPTAMLLARKGYRVLLLDKATFPSDTMSTHALKVSGCAYLNRWGLLEQVVATNCPPIKQTMLGTETYTLTGSAPPMDGVSQGYCPRRILLDNILTEAAVAAGAELREDFSVQELLMDGGRVTGVRGTARGRGTVTEHARLVIGADGLHSLVARSVEAPKYAERPPLTCAYYSYWSGVPVEKLEFYPRHHRIVIAFPTNDNLTVFFVEWTHEEFHEFRSDIEGNFLKTIEMIPDLADRVHGGKRESRFMGSADLPNFFRKPYGSGWALVGDAGYHRDPILAQGITDAFRDAELLSQAIDAGLSERQPLDEAMANYEQRRNEMAMPLYEFICQRATLEVPPELVQFFSALRGNQAQIDNFFGVIENTVPVAEFFSPENVFQILAGNSQLEPEAAIAWMTNEK